MPEYVVTINGEEKTVEADASMPLLWVLRDRLNLTGTKYSCGKGLCGSCTVHIDGSAARACVTPVSSVDQRAVTTIEGIAPSGGLHPVQEAWLAENVTQCGYCQPGQIMTAAALLMETPQPSDAAIDAAMGSVLCRCGTYQRIRRALQRLVEEGSRS